VFNAHVFIALTASRRTFHCVARSLSGTFLSKYDFQTTDSFPERILQTTNIAPKSIARKKIPNRIDKANSSFDITIGNEVDTCRTLSIMLFVFEIPA
jgi:hypothetical protein